MYNRDDIFNLAELVDAVLKENNHTRDEIVCILWGGTYGVIGEGSISIDLKSFWRFADNFCWDDDDWCSGPPYPLALVSDGGWWIEATEYDSRTSLRFVEKPKVKPPKLCIGTDGKLYDLSTESMENN